MKIVHDSRKNNGRMEKKAFNGEDQVELPLFWKIVSVAFGVLVFVLIWVISFSILSFYIWSF